MKKRSIELDAIRVLAMLLIILCHIFLEQGIMWGEYFNVGVIVFLFLSGYSFGKEYKQDWCSWHKKRLLRILPEYYFFVLAYIVLVLLLNYQISLKQVCVNLFLLQGLFTDVALPNIGHLWFITYILICYAITPLLQKVCKNSSRAAIVLVIFLGAFQVVSIPLRAVGIRLVVARFGAYVMGYYVSSKLVCKDRESEDIHRHCVRLTIPAILLNGCRLIYELSGMESHMPSIIGMGMSLIWQWVHCLLGIWLFCFLWCVFNKYIATKGISETVKRLITRLSEYSFCIYIVHQVFIYHDFALKRFITPYPLGIIVALFVIGICSAILYKLSGLLRKVILCNVDSQ